MVNTNNLDLQPSLVSNEQELEQILSLQRRNLASNISENDISSQGFVTLQHDLHTLWLMHEVAPSVIIKDKGQVIAYALTMLQECRKLIPDLEPMFTIFDQLQWKRRSLMDRRFYVMGQICVDKPYRGLGLVERLYSYHKYQYQSFYDILVTEIATRNRRSLRAHEKAGFKTIHTHRDSLDDWAVVAWDWT